MMGILEYLSQLLHLEWVLIASRLAELFTLDHLRILNVIIQECGRAGRDGCKSKCVLLFNGLLSAHCAQDMKEFLRSDKMCRRELLMRAFGYQHVPSNRHSCCDNCAIACDCGEDDGKSNFGLSIPDIKTMTADNNPGKTRPGYEQKKLFKTKLRDFRNDLII